MTTSAPAVPAWIDSAANWLTPNRIRAQAFVLALCLWGVCAVDFAIPGLFDRAGNIKFQDFLQFYISARLINQGRSGQLFDQSHRRSGNANDYRRAHARAIPTVYGPQVGLLFTPLSEAVIPGRRAHLDSAQPARHGRVLLSAVEIMPGTAIAGSNRRDLRARLSTDLPFLCARANLRACCSSVFSAAYLAFRADSDWLAGMALGCLVFKPQVLVAIPLILLLSQAWKAVAGLALAAAAQFAFAAIYFGAAVMRAYFDTMLHMSRWLGISEIGPAHIQMHSLRSFFTLLIPWPDISLALYVVTSMAAIAIAAAVWKSSTALAVRFSALILASVLVNPHLFIYDLLVLAPAFLLLVDWMLRAHPAPRRCSKCSCILLRLTSVRAAFPMDSCPTLRSSLRRAALELMARIQNSVSQICLEPTRRCITLLPIWARSSQRRSFRKSRSNSAVGSTRPTLFSALSAHSPRTSAVKSF